MSDKPKKKNRKLKEAEAVEVQDNAWERFESTVQKIVRPNKAEEARINAGIAADPDTFEISDEDFAKAKRGKPPIHAED